MLQFEHTTLAWSLIVKEAYDKMKYSLGYLKLFGMIASKYLNNYWGFFLIEILIYIQKFACLAYGYIHLTNWQLF